MRLAPVLTLFLILQVAECIDQPLKEVPASEILNKIAEGQPVKYDHVIVKGNLELDGLGLPIKHIDRTNYEIEVWKLPEDVTLVRSPLMITNSVIDGDVNLNNAVFNGIINFYGTQFNDYANFYGTQFNGYYADFSGSQFNSTADFSATQFNSPLSFGGFLFDSLANFYGSQFNDEANFRGSQFNSTADFSATQFNSPLSFGGSQFNDEANFRGSQFNSTADFSGSQFNSNSSFSGSQFNSPAYFSATQFNSPGSFYGFKFNDETNIGIGSIEFRSPADFSATQFNDYADFSGSQFNSTADFSGSQFNSTADFSGSQFNSTADFPGSQFKGYLSGWDNIINALTCDEATYLGLIKNFKEHGQFNDADDCYYIYRYRNMNTLSDFMGWISCGFGVRPMYAVYLSIIFIVLFGLVYWVGDAIYKLSAPSLEHTFNKNKTWSLSIIWTSLVINIKKMIIWFKSAPKRVLGYLRALRPRSISRMPYELCHKSFTTSVSFEDALYFSALVFFTLHPPHDWEYSEHWRYVILLEDVLGGIFITLFIVTLGNIIIRY